MQDEEMLKILEEDQRRMAALAQQAAQEQDGQVGAASPWTSPDGDCVIAEFPRRSDVLVCSLSTYRTGGLMERRINVRFWTPTPDGRGRRPTRRGLSIGLDDWPIFLEGVKALRAAVAQLTVISASRVHVDRHAPASWDRGGGPHGGLLHPVRPIVTDVR